LLIVDETRSYAQIVGTPVAPSIDRLIGRYALATDDFALFHPGRPSHIALTSGSNHGVTADRRSPSAGNEIAVTNIADRIAASGRTGYGCCT